MAKLVNLGSLCIDHIYRVPNLAGSGETVSASSHSLCAGGKGLNQSLAAAAAGAAVVHFGCVGDDGQFLIDELSKAGVAVGGIRRVAGETSGHAVIQVNQRGENAIVITGAANRRLTPDDLGQAFSELQPDDWLLLQNEINDLEAVLAMAAQRNARVAFNIAPVDGRERGYDLDNVALLLLNQIEAAALVGDLGSPEEILAALHERVRGAISVVTLGADGLLAMENGKLIRLAAHKVDTVDETAAGDAFIGYFMAGLLRGADLDSALRLGSAAGALAVTKPGAASSIPAAADVQAIL